MPLSSFPCAYSQYIALCNSIAMWNPFQAGVQLATILVVVACHDADFVQSVSDVVIQIQAGRVTSVIGK